MTYSDWSKHHHDKVINILDKLCKNDLSSNSIVTYFNYDNMIKNESNFCVLYNTNSKYHAIDELNCLFCACPHLKYGDNNSIIQSICTIDSKHAEVFKHNGISHCDCTNCFIPHMSGYIKNVLNSDNIISDYINLFKGTT